MTTAPQNVIGLLIWPILMISACGLLCLTCYNRMAVRVARMRALNSEQPILPEMPMARHAGRIHDNPTAWQRARPGSVEYKRDLARQTDAAMPEMHSEATGANVGQ